MADIAGFRMAYLAYLKATKENVNKNLDPSFSYSAPRQLFWIAAATFWCESPHILTISNVHSPQKFRVNGAFSNYPEFQKDFKCQTASQMNPPDKCSAL